MIIVLTNIIVDFQWHFPMDFHWCFPTEVHLCDFWRVIHCPDAFSFAFSSSASVRAGSSAASCCYFVLHAVGIDAMLCYCACLVSFVESCCDCVDLLVCFYFCIIILLCFRFLRGVCLARGIRQQAADEVPARLVIW